MLELKAYAKVNLGLSVLAKREDGFHELDTLFARLNVFDTLRLEPLAKGIRLEVTGADLPTGPANLCYQAAKAYLHATGIKTGLAIHLEKHIPVAAGLGGGSADAGAVLRGLETLYPASVDIVALASELGSDVPFFVLNVPAARGQGRGEILEAVTLPELHLVLLNPGVAVSAGEAYQALSGFTPALVVEKLRSSLTTETPAYFNALQPGVIELYPDIERVLEALREAGLRGALLSGSGSTCFALASSAQEATAAAASLQAAHPDWWVRAASLV